MKRIFLSIILAMLFVPMIAIAVTVTFNNTAPVNGETSYGTNGVYVESGFSFTATAGTAQYSDSIGYDLTNAPPDNTDHQLFQNGSPTGWTLSNGGTFSLISLQAAIVFSGSATTLTLTGHISGGGTIVQVLNLPAYTSAADWNTYNLPPGWTNLDSVDFAYNGSFVGIDNVVLNQSTATSIPTLSEWGMIILSSLLALVAVFALRRKQA